MTPQLLDQLYGHVTTAIAGAAAVALGYADLKTGMQLGQLGDVGLIVAGLGALGLQVVGLLPR